MSEPIRVAIVDDHPVLHEGTAAVLGREPDLEVVVSVTSLEEATGLVDDEAMVDVIVLDVRLDGHSGLELLGSLGTDDSPSPAVVVWTGFDVPQYAAYAWKHGAAGFVLKTAPVSELVHAIRTTASGGLYFAVDTRSELTRLTPRERDVVSAVVEGRSNDEIAASLGVTRRAIELHLTHLYRRYELSSRADLSSRATREGWLDVPDGPERR